MLDSTNQDHPSRAHIPPEIRAANSRRARELQARDADKPISPEGQRVLREVFWPKYFELMAESDAEG